MIDFLKFDDAISDEMLAAYIDGNATEEESTLIQNVLSSDDMLSEVADVVSDIKSYEDCSDLNFLDDCNNTIAFDVPLYDFNDDLLVAAAQEPLELNLPLDPSEDIDINVVNNDGVDDMLDISL